MHIFHFLCSLNIRIEFWTIIYKFFVSLRNKRTVNDFKKIVSILWQVSRRGYRNARRLFQSIHCVLYRLRFWFLIRNQLKFKFSTYDLFPCRSIYTAINIFQSVYISRCSVSDFFININSLILFFYSFVTKSIEPQSNFEHQCSVIFENW